MVRRNKQHTKCYTYVLVFSKAGMTGQKILDERSNVVDNGSIPRCDGNSQSTNNILYTLVYDAGSTKIEFCNCLESSVMHIPPSFTVSFELSQLDVVLDHVVRCCVMLISV